MPQLVSSSHDYKLAELFQNHTDLIFQLLRHFLIYNIFRSWEDYTNAEKSTKVQRHLYIELLQT